MASSDDIEVLDALLDAGADIEASGAVIAGGTPLADATAFAQWGRLDGWSGGVPRSPCSLRRRWG